MNDHIIRWWRQALAGATNLILLCLVWDYPWYSNLAMSLLLALMLRALEDWSEQQ